MYPRKILPPHGAPFEAFSSAFFFSFGSCSIGMYECLVLESSPTRFFLSVNLEFSPSILFYVLLPPRALVFHFRHPCGR